MDTSTLQPNLSQGLAVVGRAVAKKPITPVLAHILLEAQPGHIKLAATNLEQFITAHIDAKTTTDGRFTVPARLVTDLVGALPSESINLKLHKGKLQLACGRNTSDIHGIDAEEFPLLPHVDGHFDYTINADLLRQMIARVIIAAAKDQSRPILAGVLLRIEDDTLTMAASDGFRLSVCKTKLAVPVEDAIAVIVPADALNALAHIGKDEQEPIGLYVPESKAKVLFRLEGTSAVHSIDLITQVLDGNFPNYRQIIPTSYTTRTVLDRAQFLKACKTANIFARNVAHNVRLVIDPDNNTLTIRAYSIESGESEVELSAEIEGANLEINFSARYLIDVLSVMDGAQVVVETTAPTRPGVFKPVGSKDFVHVIMPMEPRKQHD